MIFIIVAIALSLVGLIILVAGQLPMSRERTLTGNQARAVGLALALTWPMLIPVGYIVGRLVTATNSWLNFAPEDVIGFAIAPYAEATRPLAILIMLAIALVIAYWPNRQ